MATAKDGRPRAERRSPASARQAARDVSEPEGPGEGAPLVLVTRQGRARATVRLQNPAEQPLKLARVPFSGPTLLTRRGLPLREMPLRGRLEPRQAGSVRLYLDLDPRTPAGCYPGTVQVGEQALPVTIVVPEERFVRISPGRITVDAQPGEVFERCIAVENRGNVPVLLSTPLPTPLEPREKLHELLRKAAEQTHNDDYHAFLNSLVGRARELVEANLDRLVVPTLIGAPASVAPGQTVAFSLRWRIPGELERGHGYRAMLRIAGAPLVLEVIRSRAREAPVPEVVETSQQT